MTILEAIDQALCSQYTFNIERYDCTDKQKAYYTRKIVDEGISFQNNGKNKNCIVEQFTIKIDIKIPDVDKCNTIEEADQKRSKRVEPIFGHLKQMINILCLLGFELTGKAKIKRYDEKPRDADCILKVTFTGTFDRCESVKCDNDCYDAEKLGVEVKRSWKKNG